MVKINVVNFITISLIVFTTMATLGIVGKVMGK